MKKKIKDLTLGYLTIFLISGIIVGDVFAIKYLDWWSILICLLSVGIIGVLVGIEVALFEDLESEVEVDENI